MLAIASVICALCARDIDFFEVVIWKVVGFRDMRTLCAWNDKATYVANKIPHGSAEPYHDTVRCTYHAPTGAYHEFRKEFYITAHSAYITRRKALHHVALSRETNDTL